MYNFVKSPIFQKTNTISNRVIFPKCKYEFICEKEDQMDYLRCSYEWIGGEKEAEVEVLVVNRNISHVGNTAVAKNLPIKGTPKLLKADTKFKNIAPHFLTWENLPHTFFELALD